MCYETFRRVARQVVFEPEEVIAQEICEICGSRPATMRVAVMQDGQREELNICEYDYARLTRQQQRRSSPME